MTRLLLTCLIALAQVATVGAQMKDGRLVIRAGAGIGYGIRLGEREVSCQGIVPSQNAGYESCGSTRVNVLFPHARIEGRLRIQRSHSLYCLLGLEGLDRLDRLDFHSNRKDTLTYDRYLFRAPQVNGFLSLSKTMGAFEASVGASTMLFEWASYSRWRIDGTKEKWLPTRRLLRSFRVRPQIMLTYVLGERFTRYRVFVLADMREEFDEERNTLDVRLGLLYRF